MKNELEIIAPGFVSQTLYKLFSSGWMESDFEPTKQYYWEVEGEYSILHYQSDFADNERFIWLFSDFDPHTTFDSIWLIFRDYEDEKVRRALFYLRHLFETKYFESESESAFDEALIQCLGRIESESSNKSQKSLKKD